MSLPSIFADQLPASLPSSVRDEMDKIYAGALAAWAAFRTTLAPTGWHINWPVVEKAGQYIMTLVLQFTGLVDSSGMLNIDKKNAVMAYLKALATAFISTEVPFAVVVADPIINGIISMLSAYVEVLVAGMHNKPPSPIPTVP
jgi:hypothetical protein